MSKDTFNFELNQATTLKHDDLVRLAGWDRVTFAKAGSVEGMARQYNENESAAVCRALSYKHEIAFITYAGGCITNSPAFYEEQKRLADSAITLTEGETVKIEGRLYTVKVMQSCHDRPRFSDPIKLTPVKE